MLRRLARFAIAIWLLAALSPSQATKAAASADAPRAFDKKFFARFAPKTALDMVRQLPGFTINDPVRERGLKPTVNVLLNGRRVAGSAGNVIAELRRIPAANVSQIDIVDGATLDLPGLSGQVANVIAKFSRTSGQFAWRPEFRPYRADWVYTDGEASISGSSGPVEYTFGVANEAIRETAAGRTLVYGAGFQLNEFRRDVVTREFERPSLSGSLKYQGAGESVANLNLSYSRYLAEATEIRDRSLTSGAGRIFRLETEDNDTSYEVGADYEFAVANGRLKLSGVHSYERTPAIFLETNADVGGSNLRGVRLVTTGKDLTSTGRAEYRRKVGRGDWIVAAEVGRTEFTNKSIRTSTDADGIFQDGGAGPQIDILSEERAEGALTYKRPLSKTVTMQAQLGGELSRITSGGGDGPSRSLFLPEGFLSFAWKASPRLNVDAKLEREVVDLSFLFFVPAENFSTNTRRTGNPELVPPKSWNLDVSATRSFAAYGRSSLRLYARRLEDVLEIIPFGDDQEAFGNIERASVYGLESRTTFNFDPMHWHGTKLDLRVQLEEAHLRDPLTGSRRRISNSLMHAVNLSLRRDVPKSDWAWGGSINYRKAAFNYLPTEIAFFRRGPVFGSVFVENKNVHGLTVRATVENVLGATNRFRQTRFRPDRSVPDAPFTSLETGERRFGPTFLLSISGRFGRQ